MIRDSITRIKSIPIAKWPSLLYLLFAFTLAPLIRDSEAAPLRESLKQQEKPTAQEMTALELGKPIERELAGGQLHRYQILLAEGQYASVMVEQRGIDVVVRAFKPEGKLISDFDSADGLRGPEDPELIAEAAGNYTLEVAANRKEAPVGRYEITIVELRAATENDRLLLEARISHREGVKLYNQDQVDLATPPAERALEIYERVLEEHARTAAALQLIGKILLAKGENVKAESVFERALAIAETVLPPNDLSLALVIKEVGLTNIWRGNYEKAETLLERALRLYENSPGDPQYHKIGHVLQCLATIYSERGAYAKAEAAYKRVLTIWGEAYGVESTWVEGTLSDLASVYRISGDYVQAESLLLRAIAVAEKTAVEDQPFVNYTLTDVIGVLANLYIDKGDYDKAEALLERHQAMFEKLALGQDYAMSDFFDALITVSRIKGDFKKAERLSLHAIAITEKSYGPEHFLVSTSLLRLATLYHSYGEYAKAEPLLQRALAISQKASGLENPTAASILDMLGNVHRARGEYGKAESLYQQALAIAERLFGSNHPNATKTLDNLATLAAAKGDGAEAVKFQARANAIDEHNISLNLATGSERQKLVYLRTLADKVNKTISLQLRFAPDDSRAREQAVALILQRKGRVQDTMTNSLASLRRHLSVEDEQLLSQLNATTAQLSRLVLEGSQYIPLAAQRERIGTLEEQKEKLEAEISRRSAGFYGQSQTATLEAIRAAIPGDAALIELAVYRPFDPQANDAKAYGEPRYVAYVARKQGEVQWTELGAAKEIDSAIEAWRQALRDPKRRDAQSLARTLDQKIMQPVRALVGDAVRLLVSPDGELNLIPFEALVDEQGRYLITRYAFTYLTSGRDLLRMQLARATKSNPLVVANPLFGEAAAEHVAKVAATRRPTAHASRRRSITAARDLSETYFAPLSVTEQEARAIHKLFPEASLLTGAQATESALKQMAAPRILHIATHGFFLEVAASPAAGNLQTATRAINASAKIENPLLRSGLALAGANSRASGNDDGILTALEATGLNLWGTKLVTLSACDTGVGEVKNGEGVYGLRRAFVLAGTETLVMSLWPVSDYVTREMMTAYYKGLKQGLGRGEALRQVQLSMFKRQGREHPFYWASFIQYGEWANLEGKRQKRFTTEGTAGHRERQESFSSLRIETSKPAR